MLNLLRANFSRLSVNRVFKVSIAIVVFLGILAPVWGHRVLVTIIAPDSSYSLDYYFFIYVNVVTFVMVVFCCLFMGTNYNDGIIRNIISAGHSRQAIYFSNLMINIASACVLYTAYMISALIVGLPYLGAFRYFTKSRIVILILCVYVSMISIISVTTLVGMAFHSFSVSLGISLCAVVAAFCVGIRQLNLLTETVFWSAEMTMRREWTLFFLDFLPGSQMMEFFYLRDNPGNLNPCVMLGGSAFFIAVSTVMGFFVFRKKELK